MVDEVGDVLYIASHAGPTNQGQHPSTINSQQLATVFASAQSTMNLIHCMRTWQVETIEAATFKQLKKAVRIQIAHTSLSMCHHLTRWRAGMKNRQIMTKWAKITSDTWWAHNIAHQVLMEMLGNERVTQHHHKAAQDAVDRTVTAIQYGQSSPQIFAYVEHLLP